MPLYPQDIDIGADVYSSDGHKLGELRRVVLKRSDLTLTHVVVDVGFLRSGHHLWEGGLGLDYDRVVPAEAVASVGRGHIDLAMTASEFKEAPAYSEDRYEGPQDLTPGNYDIADLALQAQIVASAIASAPGAWIVERLNRPLDSLDIRAGMGVWRNYPHEKLGEVDRGLFDPQTGKLQALVVKRGFVTTRDVILPVRYVSEIIDDVSVRVDITDEELHKLQEYREP